MSSFVSFTFLFFLFFSHLYSIIVLKNLPCSSHIFIDSLLPNPPLVLALDFEYLLYIVGLTHFLKMSNMLLEMKVLLKMLLFLIIGIFIDSLS